MNDIKCPCGLREHMEESDCRKTECDKCCPLAADERNLLAVSIKHTEYKWKFGKPCVLWGRRTDYVEKRSFSGYTTNPYKAELYSLNDWRKSDYGKVPWIKTDEPVRMRTNFCKKYRNYDTVLMKYDDYITYCEIACILPKGE